MSDTEKGQLPTAHIPGTTYNAQRTHSLETGLATDLTWETESVEAPRKKPPRTDSDLSDAAASSTGRHERLKSKRKSPPEVQETAAEAQHQSTVSRIAKLPLDVTQDPAGQTQLTAARLGRLTRSDSERSTGSARSTIHEISRILKDTSDQQRQTNENIAAIVKSQSQLTALVASMRQEGPHVPPAVSVIQNATQDLSPARRGLPDPEILLQQGGGVTREVAKTIQDCGLTPVQRFLAFGVTNIKPDRFAQATTSEVDQEIEATKMLLASKTRESLPDSLEAQCGHLFHLERSRHRVDDAIRAVENHLSIFPVEKGDLSRALDLLAREKRDLSIAELTVLHAHLPEDPTWMNDSVRNETPADRVAAYHALRMLVARVRLGQTVDQALSHFYDLPNTSNKPTLKQLAFTWQQVEPHQAWLKNLIFKFQTDRLVPAPGTVPRGKS